MERDAFEDFRSQCRRERDQQDREIYNEYKRLTSKQGNSKMEVSKYLCMKYHFLSVGTIYRIKQRVESLKCQNNAGK